MKKILITGGSGFLARNLYRYLEQLGSYDVWCSSRQKLLDAKTIVTDITDIRNIKEKLMRGNHFDAIIHCAAHIPSPEEMAAFEMCHRVNFEGTRNMLRFFAETNGEHFIYVSSLAIFNGQQSGNVSEETTPQPTSDYGNSKLGGEYLCHSFQKEFGLNISILRLGTIYGWGINPDRMISFFLRKCSTNEDFAVYGSEKYLHTIYVKDVVRIVEKMLGLKNTILNLSSDPLTKRELVAVVKRATSSNSKISFDSMISPPAKNFVLDKFLTTFPQESLLSFENGIIDMLNDEKLTHREFK